MPRPAANSSRWSGRCGHYEVWYLTLTDGGSGIGVWIRYTMTAPIGEPPTAALWFVAIDPRRGVSARKAILPIEDLRSRAAPFELRIGEAILTDERMVGGFDDVSWDLRWTDRGHPYRHVHPIVERLGLAQSVLELPHADLAVEGVVSFAGERLELHDARGGQAHIWGSKHADSWAWVHCNDLLDADGHRVDGAFIDAVSVSVKRAGRQIGPLTPVVGRFGGSDFLSVSPSRVIGNWSSYALTGWRFEAVERGRKLVVEVDADRDEVVGVSYRDPDGDLAYCYNTETASIRLHLYDRAPRVGGWAYAGALRADGRAHFEYAQRRPVPNVELHLT